MSEQTLLIIGLLIIVAIIAYYIHKHPHSTLLSGPQSRKVRFNDDVEYNYYRNTPDNINVDDIIDSEELLSDIYMDDSDGDKYSAGHIDARRVDDHRKKILRDHQDYLDSYGKFSQYQLDRSVKMKTDTTIDISDPKYRGRDMGDVYDAICKSGIPEFDSESLFDDENSFDTLQAFNE